MMNRLKTALESLDTTIDRLDAALQARLGQLDSALSETRAELATTSARAKNAAKIGGRLDDIIAEVRDILDRDSAEKEQD